MITETIILAGGRGARLSPMTDTLPKPLLPINTIPTLSHILRKIEKAGLRRATLTLGYRGEAIEKHYGGIFRTMRLRYAWEEMPLGTAGAVKAAVFPAGLATDAYGDRLPTDGDILVLSGDALFEFDLEAFIKAHNRSGADLTIAAKTLDDVTGYGVMTGNPSRIESFLEKPDPKTAPSHLVNAGIYLFSSRILAEIPKTPYDFGRELFPSLLKKGYHIAAFPFEDYWCDIGTPKSYLDANLRASCGKAVIGRGCHVAASADIHESVLLDSVTVGEHCRVTNAILSEGVSLASGVTVTASLIGPFCHLTESPPVDSLVFLENGKLHIAPLTTSLHTPSYATV